MDKIIRHHYNIDQFKETPSKEDFIIGEWLVTNGLGGYSSSTVIGVMTRKYHALLVSALPPPHGRSIMLNHLTEEIVIGDKTYLLNCEEKNDGRLDLEALNYLKYFYLENGLPVWVFQVEGLTLEKRIFMSYRQNTVYISYTLLEGGDKAIIKLSPSLNFRHHETPVNTPLGEPYTITSFENVYEISKKDFSPLHLALFGDHGTFTIEGKFLKNVFFRIESWRGYESVGELWSPGFFQLELLKGVEAGIIASSEDWKKIHALSFSEAKEAELLRRRQILNLAYPLSKDNIACELILAADQFIITPESRVEDAVRAHASGDEIRTIIAGYHWFTDWGRDTMISLEGLTLCTGRIREAGWILKTFSHYVKEGLIPNMFPEGQNEGVYHTADATLWFFHAIDRYLAYSDDFLTFDIIYPKLLEIIDFHLKGTHFNIKMDPNDGLISQGAPGYQLTWMDAKVGDYVVTPRRGKAVEINALWYNALKLMQEWALLKKDNRKAKFFSDLSTKVYQSFNQRFFIESEGYLYDVIDGEKGDDKAFRPNQLLSISLKYPALEPSLWKGVVDQCKDKLLTPYGLRTLSPDHPDFKPRYGGDLLNRDASYHQGTVWPWLLGIFIDAWVKVYPNDLKTVQDLIHNFEKNLSEAGVGTICEIFDAVEPHTAQGCMAQAWSVSEVLRSIYNLKKDKLV